MAKGKKIQITFAEGLHDRIETYATQSGLTVNQAITTMLNEKLHMPAVLSRTRRQELEKREQKILALLTPKEDDEVRKQYPLSTHAWDYECIATLAYIQEELGTLDRSPDEVLLDAYEQELSQVYEASTAAMLAASKRGSQYEDPERDVRGYRIATLKTIIYLLKERIAAQSPSKIG